MDEERGASQVSRGTRFNMRERQDKKGCPAWANPAERDRWVQKGLIVWQEETQHIIRLSATNALKILDILRADDVPVEQGVIIGEPVTRLLLYGPDRTPESALCNPIPPSPRQTEAAY